MSEPAAEVVYKWKDLARHGWGKLLTLAAAGGITLSTLGGQINITLLNPKLSADIEQLLRVPMNQKEFHAAVITAIDNIPGEIPAEDNSEILVAMAEQAADLALLRAQVDAMNSRMSEGIDHMKRLKVVP